MNDLIVRARSAIGKGIVYKLGQGGSHPTDPGPTRTGKCDCSGFALWVAGKDRDKTVNGKYLGTDAIVADALGAQAAFRRVFTCEPGVFAVYPGSHAGARRMYGHVGLVTQVSPMRGVDCGSSSGGITERSFVFFERNPKTIFVVPV